MPSRLSLKTPPDFELKRAVCSYGYFLLAPNHWEPQSQRLGRRLWAAGRLTPVTVDQPSGRGGPLRIEAEGPLDRHQQTSIKQQLSRMLRLGPSDNETVAAWRRVHPAARRRGFGRMFRSANLWEDMVKTITGCNVTWRNTMAMNRRLVERVGGGGFPTPAQVARLTPSRLKTSCRVGYRAGRIIALARAVDRGGVDLAWFESPGRETEELREALMRLDGFGPYAAANVLTLLGRFDHLPIDTETYRHYCLATGRERPDNDKLLDPLIREHYGRYAPFDFLAFWFELWRDYERRFGDAWTWDRDTTGANFTASVLKK